MKAVTVTLLLVAMGCRSAPWIADHYFESGRYLEAAAAYRAYLAEQPDDAQRVARALFRLGLAHAVPDSPIYDPRQAVELLERLLIVDPDGPYGVEATLIRNLQRQVLSLIDEVDRRQLRIAELRAMLHGAQLDLQQAQSEFEERQETVEALTREIAALREQIRTVTAELASRQRELDRLKAIDLDRPP